MKIESYASFSAGVQKGVLARRAPINVTIELTRRCPLSCAHCYNNLPVGDRAAQAGELDGEELCRLLDELSDAGALWLLLTGGEIFARSDFFQIYEHAKKRGFLITLFTNGTMITPAIAERLAELPPFSIEITLYGATKATYERLTGVPGSFDRCMRGIELLRARRLPLKLKAVAVKSNQHEVPEMRRFVEEECGGTFKLDAMLSPRLDCSQSPLSERLSPEDVVALDLEDPRRADEWRLFASRHVGPPVDPEQLYSCGGGISSCAINHHGGLSLCVLSQRETFDVRQRGFSEGWEHFLGQVRSRKVSRPTKCVACQIKGVCGMCPANAELHSGGDPEAPVEFLCETAHLRALAVGIEVPAHGECELCAGGSRHAALLEAGARLHRREAQPAPPPGRRRLHLPVVADPAGGCGGSG